MRGLWYRLPVWLAMLLVDAALGVFIAPFARLSGWMLFAAGSILWLLFVSWLLFHEEPEDC